MTPIVLTPAQQEAVHRGVLDSGFSVVLQLPTGAGKTFLARLAIEAELARGARAIYLTPLRALAAELLAQWRIELGSERVGVFTGDFGPCRPPPLPYSKARVLIMTPERLDLCTRNWRRHFKWLSEVNLVVVDELHLLGEPVRGPRLEGTLVRIRRLNPFLRVLGLSATLGNRAELAQWLAGISWAHDWRPVPLEIRYRRFRRATDKPKLLVEEVGRCLENGGQSLIFVQSRRRAEVLTQHLRDHGLSADHHHAGSTFERRRRIEDNFRKGDIRALFSTGTLEMGLNLPARQVVIYDVQRFNGRQFVPLTVCTVWQRAGRAGRPGLDQRGEALLFLPSWQKSFPSYCEGKFEPILSGLGAPQALAEQVLIEIGSGLCRSEEQVDRVLSTSLAAHQGRLGDVRALIEEMIEAGLLERRVPSRESSAVTEKLSATELGWLAVRRMLAPSTVRTLQRTMRNEHLAEKDGNIYFLDLLLFVVDTQDASPLLHVDFEELETLARRLCRERSKILSQHTSAVKAHWGKGGRHALAVIKTALALREWTRSGDLEDVAQRYGCYPFEIRLLVERAARILDALAEIATPKVCSFHAQIKALSLMVHSGLDEECVTLTQIPGLGGVLARRLCSAGVGDIEALALATTGEVSTVHGISRTRAAKWIELASSLVENGGATALKELGPTIRACRGDWMAEIDPYRLRRARNLCVRRLDLDHIYEVSGGLEPHRVEFSERDMHCDCADHAAGHLCKHIMAVLFLREDLQKSGSWAQDPEALVGLNLGRLWFEKEWNR